MNFLKVIRNKIRLDVVLHTHQFYFPLPDFNWKLDIHFLFATLISFNNGRKNCFDDNCWKLDSSFFPIIVREGRQGNCNMRLKHIVIWGKWLLWCSPKWSFFSLLPLPEGRTILWVNCRGSEALIYGQKEKRNTTENG